MRPFPSRCPILPPPAGSPVCSWQCPLCCSPPPLPPVCHPHPSAMKSPPVQWRVTEASSLGNDRSSSPSCYCHSPSAWLQGLAGGIATEIPEAAVPGASVCGCISTKLAPRLPFSLLQEFLLQAGSVFVLHVRRKVGERGKRERVVALIHCNTDQIQSSNLSVEATDLPITSMTVVPTCAK